MNYLKWLAQCRPKGIDLSDASLTFLAQGEYNENYLLNCRGGRFVFRVNHGSQTERSDQILYEYRALKRLEESGCTPKAYFAEGSLFEKGILIMEYVEGAPLNYKTDLPKAAALLRRIHSLKPSAADARTFITENALFQSRLDEGGRLLKDVWGAHAIPLKTKRLFERLVSLLTERLPQERWFTENPWRTFCNTELNSHNFIIGAEHSCVIDWEKPVLSDPVQDITQFLAPTTTLWKSSVRLSPEEIDLFYVHYGFEDKQMRERVRLYAPYLALRALAWCAMAYLEYQKPEKELSNPDTYAKIREYLEPSFMKSLLDEFF